MSPHSLVVTPLRRKTAICKDLIFFDVSLLLLFRYEVYNIFSFVESLKVHMSSTWSQLSVSEETVQHLVTLMAKEMNVTGNKLTYKNYMSKLLA